LAAAAAAAAAAAEVAGVSVSVLSTGEGAERAGSPAGTPPEGPVAAGGAAGGAKSADTVDCAGAVGPWPLVGEGGDSAGSCSCWKLTLRAARIPAARRARLRTGGASGRGEGDGLRKRGANACMLDFSSVERYGLKVEVLEIDSGIS